MTQLTHNGNDEHMTTLIFTNVSCKWCEALVQASLKYHKIIIIIIRCSCSYIVQMNNFFLDFSYNTVTENQ